MKTVGISYTQSIAKDKHSTSRCQIETNDHVNVETIDLHVRKPL